MDKIQSKLTELTENLTALDVCLKNGMVKYPELILYLQYDIPIEDSSEDYAKMKKVFQNKYRYANRYTTDECSEVLKTILHHVQAFIISIDRDGNQAQTVYKQASDIAEQICVRIDNGELTVSSNFAPY